MARELTIDKVLAGRLTDFHDSALFKVRAIEAKSEYWEFQAAQMSTEIRKDSARVDGASGFYVPNDGSLARRTGQRMRRAVTDPGHVWWYLKEKIRQRTELPRMMSYKRAFDAAMARETISDPDLSRYRIDHRMLHTIPGVWSTARSVREHYRAWSGYLASPHIYRHYYYQNLLRPFISPGEPLTVLEIGGGNGNFASILHQDWQQVRMILVDLPETLSIAIAYLHNMFPAATLQLPHEINGIATADADFTFLTVDQLDAIPENKVDLAVNCHSFQEMTHAQIATYFALIQRVTRDGGVFFCANRVEKIPCGPDAYTVDQVEPPNRFAEFPWRAGNEVLAYEVSRMSRLVDLDNIFIRIERIHNT